VIEFTPDGTVVAANENFCRTVGYTAKEIIGRHHSMFLEPSYRNSSDYREFWASLVRGEFKSGKFERWGADGRQIWLQATYNPIVDRQGKTVRVVKFATDVTATERLASEASYKSTAFSNASVAMMLIDKDLKIQYVNAGTIRLFKDNLSEFRSLWPEIDPDRMVGECIDKFHRNPSHQRQILADPSRLPMRAEITVGSLKIELNVSAIQDASGAHVGSMLEWSDVTATRLNAAKLKALDGSQATIEFSVDGTILHANENFCRTLGYSLSDIVGRHHAMFVQSGQSNTPEYREFWASLAKGEFQSGKFERVGRGGRQIWIQATYNPVLDANGKVYRVVKFASDITDIENERRQAESEREARAASLATVVSSLAGGLKALSEGDLTLSLNEAFSSEYDELRLNFNTAAEKLKDAMRVIAANAGGISSGASEISQAADDLSKRTEQQAASLEETAAALDQITATVRKTADSAKQANSVVVSARTNAEASGQVVRETISAMAEIEKSSKQISQIIGVIDEIAFQTNLLALNAGVEAARAGDAGRGFAVVASEVRALAQRSSDAAKEIKGLISASTLHVESGVKLVGEAGRALSAIGERVTEISGLVSEISASAQEQSTALGEVNTAINQMDQVTQQNAAMVEESTAASHSLSHEAQELMALIARFKSGVDGGAKDAEPRQVSARPQERRRPEPQTIARQRQRVAQFAAQGGVAAVADSDWEEF